MFCFIRFSRWYEKSTVNKNIFIKFLNKKKNNYFSLPLSENSNAIDYILPDYNEIKQGYVQTLLSTGNNNAENSKKSSTKQQQQVNKIGFN